MQHILQFAIDIDDEQISDSIYKNAEKKCVEAICKEFKQVIYNVNGWGNQSSVSNWTEKMFNNFLADNRDAIVDKAAAILADKLARSKKVRELAGEIAAESKKQLFGG